MPSVSFCEKSNGLNAENTHQHPEWYLQNRTLTSNSLGQANPFYLTKLCVECLFRELPSEPAANSLGYPEC